MATPKILIPKDEIAAFCEKWLIVELSLFGSVLRDDFRPDSDVDVMVSFAPSAEPSLFDHAEMQDELEALFGRKIDLVTRHGIESSSNLLRRNSILSGAEAIHVAG